MNIIGLHLKKERDRVFQLAITTGLKKVSVIVLKFTKYMSQYVWIYTVRSSKNLGTSFAHKEDETHNNSITKKVKLKSNLRIYTQETELRCWSSQWDEILFAFRFEGKLVGANR